MTTAGSAAACSRQRRATSTWARRPATSASRPWTPCCAAARRRWSSARAVRAGGPRAGEAEFGPAVPAPEPHPLPRRQLPRARARRRAPADHLAGDRSSAEPTPSPSPYGELIKPGLTERFDYEGELGLVIGRGGRYIPADEAFAAIAGYVVLNDGTAREWQRAATQWTPGKNFDGSMPIGPEVVTTDEVDLDRRPADDDAQRRGHAVSAHVADDLRHPADDRVPLVVHDAAPRRRDRHRDAGGVGFARKPPVWLHARRSDRGRRRGRREDRQPCCGRERATADWPWHPPATRRRRCSAARCACKRC